MQGAVQDTINVLGKSKYVIAFTGAGISVASGIPPFRGENGIWNKYKEKLFDINYFINHTQETWDMLCDGFYETTLKATPNAAHIAIAKLEESGLLKSVVTQNIDNLHTKAGNKNVCELHGNAQRLICMKDNSKYSITDFDLQVAPRCKLCNEILKPDFVFFGEMLPEYDLQMSIKECSICDVMLVIGSTGTVYPAASLPFEAKKHKATIIEINPSPSTFTNNITDIFIPLKATEAMTEIIKHFNL
ncbi:MAG: NAD-dependent deacylase [Endomicrobium sp.]|jgi:NAD-dependent deacetylase|nr:NAD-dependent deacylase [Endomicrobium sp.]